MAHVELNSILVNFQHWFRKKHSCETQLITTTETIQRSLDKGRQTDIQILDFSKAFDTVAHERLLTKLAFYGVTGKTKTTSEHGSPEEHRRW